jgi:hypothetical protein
MKSASLLKKPVLLNIPDEKNESFANHFDAFLLSDEWDIVPLKKPKLIVIEGTSKCR